MKFPLILLLLLYLNSIPAQNKDKETFIYHMIQSKKMDTLAFNFAKTLENYIATKNYEGFRNSLDIPSFNKNIEQSITFDTEKNRTFIDDFLKKYHQSSEYQFQQTVDELTDHNYFDLVNYRFDIFEETYFVLFRKYNEETGLNYLDFQLCMRDGKVYYNDIFNYSAGEKQSESVGLLLNMSLRNHTSDKAYDSQDFEDSKHVVKAMQHFRKQEFQEAYENLEALEGEMKNMKVIYTIKMQIASQINMDLYEKVLTEFEEQFQGDPKIILSIIDFYLMKENYAKAFSLINVLQKATNDNFVDYLRGNIYFSMNNHEKTKEYYDRVINNYPNFPEVYLNYLELLDQEKDYSEMVRLLEHMTQYNFSKEALIHYFQMKDKNGNVFFEDFINSKEYKKWQNNNELASKPMG